jgi:hypothetical protein
MTVYANVVKLTQKSIPIYVILALDAGIQYPHRLAWCHSGPCAALDAVLIQNPLLQRITNMNSN